MTDPKNITIFAIPYLTLCAVLFHIAYWDTFNLNGLSYISVSDIFKSAVYPILSTSIFTFIGLFIGGYLASDTNDVAPNEPYEKTSWFKALFIVILFITWTFCLHLLDYLPSNYKWLIWPILAGLPLNGILYYSKLLNFFQTTNRYRFAFMNLLTYLPFIFFASGKIESEKIQNNIEYKYSTRIITDTTNNAFKVDTIKYLGTTEKNIIFTDLKNNSIFLIKSDKIDTLILKTKK